MAHPLSSTQVDRLGARIRDAASIDDEDLTLLQGHLLAHNETLQAVAADLRAMGLEPTTRLKTTGTIVDKLRREAPITLRGIRDLAGARVVQRMTLDQQDSIRDQLLARWPDAKLIDRRAQPNHGYRAVHVIPRVSGCQVEIQVRTYYQDTWAQMMEWFADRWGRQIRYGGEPTDPEKGFGERTRARAVLVWIAAAADIAELEALENRSDRAHRVLTDEAVPGVRDDPQERDQELLELDEEIDRRFGVLRQVLRDLRAELFQLPT